MAEKNVRPKFRRTRYFISARYQLKYIGTILVFMFLAVAMCAFTVYYTGISIFAEKLSNVYPQARVVPLLNMINYRILANIMLLLPVVALIGTYLSHKIAGPVYRLEHFLSDMSAGKLTSHITLRKGDEFTGLAAKINELTDSLRVTLTNQRTSLRKVVAEMAAVRKMADSKAASIQEIDSNIDRISNELLALEHELDRFKT